MLTKIWEIVENERLLTMLVNESYAGPHHSKNNNQNDFAGANFKNIKLEAPTFDGQLDPKIFSIGFLTWTTILTGMICLTREGFGLPKWNWWVRLDNIGRMMRNWWDLDITKLFKLGMRWNWNSKRNTCLCHTNVCWTSGKVWLKAIDQYQSTSRSLINF